MRLSRSFVVAIVAVCAGGAASRQLWPRDARAQASSSASTIYIPWEGLVFRTPDGRAIARLSHGPHGGSLELYGDHEEAAARLSAGAIGASHSVAREPYPLDDVDPWTAGSLPKDPPAAVAF